LHVHGKSKKYSDVIAASKQWASAAASSLMQAELNDIVEMVTSQLRTHIQLSAKKRRGATKTMPYQHDNISSSSDVFNPIAKQVVKGKRTPRAGSFTPSGSSSKRKAAGSDSKDKNKKGKKLVATSLST
jgi:hypothetical protein